MTINLRKITSLAVFLTLCCASAIVTMGQQASAPASPPKRVIKYNGDMAAMLRNVTEIFRVQIGLEVAARQPRAQVSFELRDPTVHDVLNAIVQSAPGYKWRESEGFIEVLPVEESSPLLDATISNFHVSDADRAGALDQLLNLPEVQDGMRAMGLNRRDYSSASAGRDGDKFSMTLQGVTLRHALHKIFKESGGRFWVFQRSGPRSGNEFFSISNEAR